MVRGVLKLVGMDLPLTRYKGVRRRRRESQTL